MRHPFPGPFAAALLLALGARAAHGQAAAPAGCYGFVFGRWHPDLDLAAAGHAPLGEAGPQAPNGRGWAADDPAAAHADSAELMLLPTWWPAGVRLRAARLPAVGDTVRGVATALVADGRATAPRAQALVWGTRCEHQAQTSLDTTARSVAPRAAAADTPRARPALPSPRP